MEWNKLDLNISNSASLTSFKGDILKFMRPSKKSVFLFNNPKWMQLLIRLGFGSSNLEEHKFKHNFQVTLNLVCNFNENIETSRHYHFHCSLYTDERRPLLNVIQGNDNSILKLGYSHIVDFLLYGRKFLNISSKIIVSSFFNFNFFL